MINVGSCARCKCEMWLPDSLNESARRSENVSFYCAYGHAQYFPQGESEETKLRRERDCLTQQVAEKNDAIAYQRKRAERTERQLSATKGVVTRIKNRVGHGVCPCCTRSFANLARHMQTQHSGFAAEAAE